MILTIALGIVVAGILGGALALVISSIQKKRTLRESLEYSLFLVRLPRQTKKEGGDFKQDINLFEQFLANLASFKKPFVFEIAVPHIGEEIHFYFSVHRDYRESATRQLQGTWSGAAVEEVKEDYNIFNSTGAASGAYLTERENFSLPIRTYAELGADTLSSILGGFSKINELGEGAALQIVARPADDEPKNAIRKYLESFKKGFSRKQVFAGNFSSAVKEATAAGEKDKKEERVLDESAVKMLQAKLQKPLFEANVRICAGASTGLQAQSILDGILSGFEQFGSPEGNSLKSVKPKNPSSLIYQFVFRAFEENQKIILNTEEFASIFHFPIPTTETPKVKWLNFKEAPPPPELPKAGLLIGESAYRGEIKQVRITDEDRRRHIYIIGQTGTGKSALISNCIAEDIKNGKGLAVIDPHGDLAEGALTHIPEERLKDVIYFDPGDLSKPLGLNMLEYRFERPEEKTFIVNEMQSIFNKLFSQETMGPMFEQYMRNALLLLMEDMAFEPATLIEVPRVFTDAEFRKRKLARIKNPVVIDFWEKEATKAGGEASLANMTPYITSKFNNFISNDYMRPIIGQAKSAFNFREAMDSGKIILINLSKGKIGDINANLLGMVFAGKILMAALSRVDVPQEERRDFNLYIDEFQNFTTDSISTILSEARKYRLNLTVAHQFIAQLTENIRDAIFGNVGAQLVFRVGSQDAEFLVKQFEPVFDQNDLINIQNFNAYAKMLVNGQPAKPFNFRTLKPDAGDRGKIEKLKEFSREHYGMPREQVETEIYKRLRE